MKTLLDCSFILLPAIVYCNGILIGAFIHLICFTCNGVHGLNGRADVLGAACAIVVLVLLLLAMPMVMQS